MCNILVGCTGSVATIKLPLLVDKLLAENFNVRVVCTEHARHFFVPSELHSSVNVFYDSDEWSCWSQRGDPVLHIELGKWADVLLIAPLDANTLSKLATGQCDNLLTCIVRAWDLNNKRKSLIFCPAMNIRMFSHPITNVHIDQLQAWGYLQVSPIEKTLICGDSGLGGMAEVDTIVQYVKTTLNSKLYNK